jgi:hypothetical protein
MKNRLSPILILGLLSACSKPSSAPSTPATEQVSPPAAQSPALVQPGDAMTLVKSALGPDASVAAGRAVSELRADFNGDHIEDQLLVVTANRKVTDLPANVRVVRPWPLNEGESQGDNLAHGASVNLAIIHGPLTDAQPRIFVLHNDNTVSLLDAPAGQTLTTVKLNDVAKLEEPELAAVAKGDLLTVPTEAGIDTYIYWDGVTYKAFAPTTEP